MGLWPFRKTEHSPKVEDVFFDEKKEVLSLREKTLKLEISRTMVFEFVRRHRHLIITAIFCIVLVSFGFFFKKSKAEVTSLYPSGCLGGWENPKNAEGSPTLPDGATGEAFTKDNSAILKNTEGDLYCGGFQGEIPEGATPTEFALKLSWTVDDGEVSHDPTQPIQVIDTTTGESTNTQPENTNDIPPSEPPPENILDPIPQSDPVPSPEQSLLRFFGAPVYAQVDTEPVVPPESAPAPLEVIEVQPTPPADVPLRSTDGTPTETPVTTIAPSIPETINSGFLRIDYTLDGVEWQTLVTIDRRNWREGKFELPIGLRSWKELEKIQIRIVPLSTIDIAPVVYLDGMAIEVSYESKPEQFDPNAPTVKITDPSLEIISDDAAASESSPLFTVTDPALSTSEIQGLIDAGKAEIVEDKNGTFDTEKKPATETPNLLQDTLPKIFGTELGGPENAPHSPPEISPATGETSLLYQQFKKIEERVRQTAADTAAVWQNRSLHSFSKNLSYAYTHTASTPTPSNRVSLFSPEIAYAQSVVAPIEVVIFDSQNQEADIAATITTTYTASAPQYHVSLIRPREFRPGRYRMRVTLHSNNANIVSEQNFSWGVLSINIDRSIEQAGNDAYLQFGVLNDGGYTICNADLDLRITGPTGSEYNFSTNDETIIRDEQCGPDNVISVPDYYAHFTVPSDLGRYAMVLTAHTANGVKTINDHFDVHASVPFDLRRVGPTRIFPLATYPITMYVTATNAWEGTITETVPSSFEISAPQQSVAYDSIENGTDEKIIRWHVSLAAGETTHLGYRFLAPPISPEFYLLGPAKFYTGINTEPLPTTADFQEVRSWQIASDATCSSQVSSGNWNTIGTWDCGHVPIAADNVVITAGQTITMDVASAALGTLTVNGTLDTSAASSFALSFTTLSIGSAGTLTANGSAISVTGTSGPLLSITSGGTFTGGTSVVTVTGNASSTLTGGTGTFTGSNSLVTLTINRTGVTYTLGSNLTVTGTTTITLGILDTSNSGNYAFSTGKISIANSASAKLFGNASTITLTGTTSTLFTRGANGVFTQGTSEVIVQPASANATGITFLSSAVTFHRLTIDASNFNVLNAGAAITMSSTNAANRLYIKSGVLNDGGNQIAGTANGTLVIDGGAALCIGGRAAGTLATCDGGATPSTATTFPSNYTNGNITLASTSTVYYNYNANANFSVVPTYGNLKFRAVLATADKTYTMDAGTLTVTGDWDIFPQAGSALKLTVSMSGAVVVTGTTSVHHGNNSGTSGSLLSTNNNALTTGFVTIGTSGCGVTAKCTLDAGSSTITLTGTSGTLYTRVGNGVFTQGTSEVIVASASGTPTLLSTGATFHRLTINSTATVINAGAVITMSSTDAANRLYIQAGVLNDGGNTIVGTANGTLVIDGGATLCIGGTAAGTNATCNSGATIASSVSFPTNYTNGNITLAATSTVAYLGDVDTTISVTPTYGNLLFSPTITSGRSYTFGGAATINGNFTINPTAASSIALTAKPAATITVAAGKTTTIQGTSSGTGSLDLRPLITDYNLSTGLLNIGAGGTLDASSAASTITLTGTSGTLFTLNASGTFNISSGTPTVTLSGNGDATVNSGTPTFYDLTSSGTGTKTLGGDITVNHVLTISNGTFDGGSSTMTLAGTTGTPFPAPTGSGAWSAGTGTVTYNGNNSGGNTTVLNTTYYNLTLNNGSETYVLAGTTTVNAAGITTITAGTLDTTASNYALSTGKLSIAGTFTANASVVTLTAISGTLITRTGTFNANTSEVVVTGASGTPTLLSAATSFHKLTINTSATVVNAGAVITMLSANAANKLYIQAGVLNDDGNTIVGTANGTLVVDGGAALCISGTAGGTSATCNSGATPTAASTFPTNYTNGNITLAVTSTVYYLANGTQTISATPTYGNLTLSPIITSGRSYTFGGAVTINGNFTINPTASSTLALTVNPAGDISVGTTKTTTVTGTTSGTSTLDLRPSTTDYNLSTGNVTIGTLGTIDCASAASTITVAGSWSNAGTFTAGSSTVLFNGATTASIGGGPTTFYKLTITHTAAKEVDFSTNALHIIHVTNLFSVTGSAGNLIKLYSSSSATKWHFHPTGTASVDYADVRDGGCESGAITISPTHSTNSGNNESCWSFMTNSLSFSISDNTVGFGTLTTANARYATGDTNGSTSETEAHTLTVNASSAGGYVVTVLGATLTSGTFSINAIGGTNTASSAGTEQFGIRLNASGGTGTVSSPYAASGFAYAGSATTASQIASATTGDGVTTTYSVRYLTNIAPATEPGSYQANLTYVVTATY